MQHSKGGRNVQARSLGAGRVLPTGAVVNWRLFEYQRLMPAYGQPISIVKDLMRISLAARFMTLFSHLPIRFLLPFAVVLLSPLFASAAVPAGTANERILQQELRQQQVQRTTSRVADQLSTIIEEFERNGIAGEDVKVLQAIRSVLGQLSDREMNQVITLLQEARRSDDSVVSRRNVADAFSGQKTIITQLKQLVLEYQRQQALYELSIRLRELATRQAGNMRRGVWLAKASDQKTRNSFSEEQKLNLQLQESEQVALRDETQLLVNRLDKLSRESDGSPTGERPKAALKQATEGGLKPALDGAVEDLKQARMLSASGNEKRARDQMREVARLLLLSKDAIDLLRAAIAETESAILQQRQVIEETRKIERKEDATAAEDRQFEVVDNSDLIRRDINDVAPTAAGYLRNAIDGMQETREVLGGWERLEKKRDLAQPKQREALTHLESARRALQDQLERAEAEAAGSLDTLARLKKLQESVKGLITRETKLKDDAAATEKKPQELKAQAPVQGEIRDQTQDVQQEAASAAAEAANALRDAAEQMEKSQKSLARSQNSPEAQQAAIESLKKADAEIAKEVARLEEAKKELAKLEDILQRLIVVIEQEQQLQLKTTVAGLKPSTPPLQEFVADQLRLMTVTGGLQKETQEPLPSAASHLGEARGQMEGARQQLEASYPRNAQAPQARALVELQLARRLLEDKINDLRADLGLSQKDPSQSLADVAEAIEKAQQEVNDALSQMANAPAGLMEALQKQQQEIANALADDTRSNPAPQVGQAQKTASQAAQDIGAGNLPQAIKAMKKTRETMKAAQEARPEEAAAKSLDALQEKQAEVQQMAEALAAAQEAAPAGAMDAAAESLTKAAQQVGPIAAGAMGALPSGAQGALQAAQNALQNAAAQAAADQAAPAQQNAANAAQALAQAKAALAMAQAGLSSQMAGQGSPSPGQGQSPGQNGQGKGPGQGQGQGQGQTPGQPQPGQGAPSPLGDGKSGNWNGPGGADGQRRAVAGSGEFLTLPRRDRAAIQQSQAEKYPQEYGPLVEQYLKNLSDQAAE